MENNISEKKKTVSPARIVICLTVICVAVAALLGVVDHLTREKIKANEAAEKKEAIISIFGEGIEAINVTKDGADNELYLIVKDGKAFGYCAEITATGFGGDIKMMVGVDGEKKVCGTYIVTMSETPGLGARAKEEPWFLEQFTGKSGTIEVGNGVDALSGATITSKAVAKGVNDALALDVDLAALASENGKSVWGAGDAAAPGSQTPETEAAETEPVDPEQTDPAVTDEPEGRLEETISYVDGIEGDFVSPSAEYPSVGPEVITETDEFITETEEPPKDRYGNPIFPPETDEETEEVTE